MYAVGSRSAERAEAKRSAVGAEKAYSYEELLADSDVDAVYIGLPNGEHARWALATAQAGKHLLCDKSLTLTASDARKVRDAFQSRGLRLVEGFMVRHHPQWTLLGDLLAQIGPVSHVRAWFRANLDREDDHRWSGTLGGGSLFDLGCYAINAARFVLREEPIKATAVARWRSEGADESTDALLEFPSGAIASIHGSLRGQFEQGLVVSGATGRIIVERPFVPHWAPTEIWLERDGSKSVHRVDGANHYLHMIEHFEQCVLDPKIALWPAEDGLANVTACELVRNAS